MEINRVRDRLAQLQEMSQDPEYDRYLAQMVRDLDTGKATPEQVEREARRSYEIYKERMHIPKKEAEFKVGIHVVGVLGAVFVLAGNLSLRGGACPYRVIGNSASLQDACFCPCDYWNRHWRDLCGGYGQLSCAA